MLRRINREERSYSICIDSADEFRRWISSFEERRDIVGTVEEEVIENLSEFIQVSPCDEHDVADRSRQSRTVRIRGVSGSPTYDFYFYFTMTFPPDYPFKPFSIDPSQFLFHPKVTNPYDKDGRPKPSTTTVNFCPCDFPYLNDEWSPPYTFLRLLLPLRKYLFSPARECKFESFCCNALAYSLFADGKFDEYDAKVLDCCERYAQRVEES